MILMVALKCAEGCGLFLFKLRQFWSKSLDKYVGINNSQKTSATFNCTFKLEIYLRQSNYWN